MDEKQKESLEISDELRQVALEGDTEAPFSGKFVHHKAAGDYVCVICGVKLFSSDAKFDSGTGWPSFTEPSNLANISLREDFSEGMKRTEVTCKSCGAHLGHVFADGPQDRGGKRYCINSVCLAFIGSQESTGLE